MKENGTRTAFWLGKHFKKQPENSQKKNRKYLRLFERTF